MKTNKLKIDAFEKYTLTNASKTLIKGGYPDGWTPDLGLEEGGDPIGDDGGPKDGGPKTSGSTGMAIKPQDTNTTMIFLP